GRRRQWASAYPAEASVRDQLVGPWCFGWLLPAPTIRRTSPSLGPETVDFPAVPPDAVPGAGNRPQHLTGTGWFQCRRCPRRAGSVLPGGGHHVAPHVLPPARGRRPDGTASLGSGPDHLGGGPRRDAPPVCPGPPAPGRGAALVRPPSRPRRPRLVRR